MTNAEMFCVLVREANNAENPVETRDVLMACADELENRLCRLSEAAETRGMVLGDKVSTKGYYYRQIPFSDFYERVPACPNCGHPLDED